MDPLSEKFKIPDPLSFEVFPGDSLEEFPPILPPPQSSLNQTQPNVLSRVLSLVQAAFGTTKEQVEHSHRAVQINREAVIEQVDLIINTINDEKESVLEEFHGQVEPFIKRILDPILCDAQRLKEKLQDKEYEGVRWLQATTDVELVLRYATIERVKERISDAVFHNVHDTLDRDIATLVSCQEDAVHSIVDGALRLKVEDELNNKLLPVFERTRALTDSIPDFTSVRDLFLWKQSIDQVRAALTERGLLVIDSVLKSNGVQLNKNFVHTEDEDEDVYYPESRLQDLREASERFLVAFSAYSFEDEWEEALFIMRQLREEVLQIDPHTLATQDRKILFDQIIDLIMKAEDLIRPS